MKEKRTEKRANRNQLEFTSPHGSPGLLFLAFLAVTVVQRRAVCFP